MTSTLTAPAPAGGPAVPPVDTLPRVVVLTVLGAVTGCLGLALVWHDLWRAGAPLVYAGNALFIAAVVVGVFAGQDGA